MLQVLNLCSCVLIILSSLVKHWNMFCQQGQLQLAYETTLAPVEAHRTQRLGLDVSLVVNTRTWKVCKCLTHILKKKNYPGGKKSFSLHFVFKCQNIPAAEPVHRCESIHYLEAQTQMVRCPTVLEEMKCNVEVLPLHSYNFITVWHSKLTGMLHLLCRGHEEQTPAQVQTLSTLTEGFPGDFLTLNSSSSLLVINSRASGK